MKCACGTYSVLNVLGVFSLFLPLLLEMEVNEWSWRKGRRKPPPNTTLDQPSLSKRESSFETMDSKAQCLENAGQNIFVQPTAHCCNIPFPFLFLSQVQKSFWYKLFSSELLQCTAGCLSEQSVTNGGYCTWSTWEDEFRLQQVLSKEYSSWSQCVQAVKLWLDVSISFSSQEWPYSLLGKMCWLTCSLLKALLEGSCHSYAVAVGV